jgi:hypothetical protein
MEGLEMDVLCEFEGARLGDDCLGLLVISGTGRFEDVVGSTIEVSCAGVNGAPEEESISSGGLLRSRVVESRRIGSSRLDPTSVLQVLDGLSGGKFA